MAVPKTVQAQRDFSAGEIAVDAKRSDQAQDTTGILRSGLRQASNFRILNSKALSNRPGRSVLRTARNRVDEITISPGLTHKFEFSTDATGTLQIYDQVSSRILITTALGWSTQDIIDQVTWCIIDQTVYIAAPNIRPLTLTWNGTNWTTPTGFAFASTSGGQIRSFFRRLSPKGVTMAPSATTGAITMAFSPAVTSFSAAMIGAILRFCGRQIQVTGFTSTALLSGTVLESLPPGQSIAVAPDPRNLFALGDEVIGQTSNARGLVTALSAIAMTVQLLPTGSATALFNATEIVSGPGGSVTSSAVATVAPQAVAVWDDEVMNSFRGWPASIFADQSRLGFCNFPGLPGGIGWSAFASPTDCYVDGSPTAAILEVAPDKVQVYHVVPGPESSEFVFCDTRIYYIPITPNNPLKAGSVAFQILSSEGAAQVQPRAVQEVLIYINAGKTSVMTIIALGAYTRPYEIRNISELHPQLIRSPRAIAAPSATDQFEERYVYVLNNDGTIAVGKYHVTSGQFSGAVGWTPWSGEGSVTWISARSATVLFTTAYANGISILEQLDLSKIVDGAMIVNSPPAALNADKPVGFGSLWWLAGQQVDLHDGLRIMGTYQVDALGNLVPQFRGGENLASPTLISGKSWTATVEPFVPAVAPGDDRSQRMRKRRIARAVIYVKNSSGFRFDRLKDDDQSAELPPLGTVLRTRRIPTWNQGDDPTQPPPQREQAYSFRSVGRAHDPRVAFVKDTPGTLQILEIALEVTV